MRDYTRFDKYLNKLSGDIYEQPPDQGHTDYAIDYLDWALNIIKYKGSVLDVGCGQGFCKPLFEKQGFSWTGATLGKDYQVCNNEGLNVFEWDMSFLPVPDGKFDVLFGRHVLEHSPFPLLTLMEWRRVAKSHILLVLPSPDYWGFAGINHYSVLSIGQWEHLFSRAGLRPIAANSFKTDNKTFLKHYLPYIKDRENLKFQGEREKFVEYWYILEKCEEKIS